MTVILFSYPKPNQFPLSEPTVPTCDRNHAGLIFIAFGREIFSTIAVKTRIRNSSETPRTL
jgi:hypothetical protein